MSERGDPGWWPSLRELPRAMIPFVGLRRGRVADLRLLRLRTLHLSMVVTPLLFVVAMAFSDPGGSDGQRYPWAWLIIGGTVVAAWFQVSFTERRLDAATDEPMATRIYLSAYFLRLALALAPFLMGVGLSFVTGTRATYFVGAALTEILLWVIAPSRTNLQRRTERFRAAGKDIDMTRALQDLDPPRPDVPE